MFFKRKYHYVDKCPRCNSFKTGYVVKRATEKDCNEAMYNGLLNGELIEAEIGYDFGSIDNNLFCYGCGARWHGEVIIKKMTDDEILEQQKIRCIDEDLIDKYYSRCFIGYGKKQIIKSLTKQQNKINKNVNKKQKTKIKVKK